MGFDEIYSSIEGSRVYREAVFASATDLPDWLVPFSLVNGALLERIAGLLGVKMGDAFLDLACGAGGPGVWMAERTGASLVGVDSSPAAIRTATVLAEGRRMRGQARFIVADATATGLPNESVSAAMSIDALVFVDPKLVAKEIARVLKSGGIVAATAPESLGEPFTPTMVHDYVPIFENAGFKVLLHEELPAHAEQQVALYRAILQRAGPLIDEVGEAAEDLLNEARHGLLRTEVRVRHMLILAKLKEAVG